MRPRALALVALAAALAGSACGADKAPVVLPAPLSSASSVRPAGLLAGFGRADITPPPGIGLAGYSIENQQARGYRHRLYARAVVLVDARGERLALVVADLPHVSAVLHRLTAQRLVEAGTGLGADRLMVSATHSHSAPGNFYEARTYNQQGGRFAGYDPHLVEFLVAGFTQAVRDAIGDLQPAKAGWKSIRVDSLTVNRSIDAFRLNPWPPLTPLDGPTELPESLRAVDRTFTMLRVDRCPKEWRGECRPKGAFSIFAIHGTAYPAPSDLLDADIHGLLERAVERHIESLDPGATRCAPEAAGQLLKCGFRSSAFHLLANGTHGDVSPNLPGYTRCELLRFRLGRRAEGPRAAPAAEEWRPRRKKAMDDCLARTRLAIERLGAELSAEAVRLFQSIETRRDLELGRAVETVDLHHAATGLELCEQPLTGTANYAGGQDGRSRIDGWKVFWFWHSRIEQGGQAINRNPSGCHGAKVIGLGPLQRLVIRRYGLPTFAQVAVFRVGNRLLGLLPAEVTTEAGMRMKRRMEQMSSAGGSAGDTAVVVSLSNGFMQYVTTAEEYEEQRYEGGSSIYGSNSARALETRLAALASSLAQGDPIIRLLPIDADPGPMHSYFRRATDGPRPSDDLRKIRSLRCGPDLVTVTWRDAYPGLLAPAEGQVLEIQQRAGAGSDWSHAAWDDQSDVEVRARGAVSKGYEWEARWHRPPQALGEVRLVIPARPKSRLPELVSDPVPCANRP